MRNNGGPGSGNFGHAGRPGERGGSAPAGSAPMTDEHRERAKAAIKQVVGGLSGRHTVLEHLTDDGVLTPEREKLHNDIVEKILTGKTKATTERTFTVLGGGPASGKTTLIRSGAITMPPENESVLVDADGIKKQLPEYIEGVAKGDKGTAAWV